jgi:hypothetical protein
MGPTCLQVHHTLNASMSSHHHAAAKHNNTMHPASMLVCSDAPASASTFITASQHQAPGIIASHLQHSQLLSRRQGHQAVRSSREIDDVGQHARALDVLQELIPPALVSVSALDEAWDVSQGQPAAILIH